MSSCKEFFEEKSLNLIAHQAHLRAKKTGVVKFSIGSSMYNSEEVILNRGLIIELFNQVQVYGIDDVIKNIDLILVYYQSKYTIENFSNIDD
ncbi:MAG: hypothetical protein Q7J24_03600 [Desulfomicrobium sp.]|nr:hypothetical protein [Desulfomicrobium sp.]